jgi:hypothetical protein
MDAVVAIGICFSFVVLFVGLLYIRYEAVSLFFFFFGFFFCFYFLTPLTRLFSRAKGRKDRDSREAIIARFQVKRFGSSVSFVCWRAFGVWFLKILVLLLRVFLRLAFSAA